MRVYEFTFVDVGFLFSSELWSAWLAIGFIVGAVVIIQQFFGSTELLDRRKRKFKRLGAAWIMCAIAFSIIAWPITAFVWARSRIA